MSIIGTVKRNCKSGPKKSKEAIRKAILDGQYSGLTDRAIARQLGVSPTTVSSHRIWLEKHDKILPRGETGQSIQPWLYEVSSFLIRPAPANDKLYDPVDEADPGFLSLVKDIDENGQLTPLGVSQDGYIFSGNRRFAALTYLGIQRIKVQIRGDLFYHRDRDEFVKMLRSCNIQREKTLTEKLREGIVGMEDEAWQNVKEYREEEARLDGAEPIILYGEKHRSEIRDKIGLKDAIVKVVEDNEDDWPLSDRKVFYLLLNVRGLLRNDRLKTQFLNHPDHYGDVCDMLTRLRIDETIPFDAIGDETRPVTIYNTHKSVTTFIEKELENLFSGYWRDLLQSQPNWIELLVEKNTVATSLKNIAAKYTVPMTSGRGYSSLPPRKQMLDRFRASGREKLVLITVTDHDPEGIDIPNSFGVSLRDDFDLPPEQLVIIKAALTFEQVQRLNLHEGQFAKEDSSRYARYLEKYGKRCWELEAVPTDTLREIVEDSIRSVLKLNLFDLELSKEKQEQADLNSSRRKIRKLICDSDAMRDLEVTS